MFAVQSALMPTVTRTYLLDDLDGSEGQVSTVAFGLDNKEYEIDLSAANQAPLREKLESFVAAAQEIKPQRLQRVQRVPQASVTRPGLVGKEQAHAVRAWAARNGHRVSARCRTLANVQQAFDAAH